MPSTRSFGCLALTAIILAFVCGCPPKPKAEPPVAQPPNYWKQLGPGEKVLVKLTDPHEFPDFGEGFMRKANLEQAANYSLEYLSKSSSKKYFPYLDITHERAVASLHAFIDLLHSAQSGPDLDAKIKQQFDIYQSRGCDERRTVLFTGYYRPIFDGRLKPDGEFKYPLYRKPDDIELDPATETYHRKGGGAYFTRAEMDNGALANKGLELCYLRDRFEAYIVTVQGSGKLKLEDGTFFEIGYAANNGYDYTSIGQKLVEKGLISPSELSLQGLIRFFKQHPDQLDATLSINARYVFFMPRTGGPFGSLSVPVTPFRSIATDKEVYPRACVGYLCTKVPARGQDGTISDHAYSGFALDQDTGGAIRAAGRCDFFLGTGPEVGELAGRTLAEGHLYYIFVKQGQVPPAARPAAESPAAPAGGASPQ